MRRASRANLLALHLAVIALLFLAQFVLPPYHHTNLARIMVLATFAMGYNILLGYTGLMSLGHAMFFAAGMYATGLSVYYLEFTALPAFALGIAASLVWSLAFGLVALRTSGVSFLIVTMMFGKAGFLTILYFNEITLGDQGFTLSNSLAPLTIAGQEVPFSHPALKFNVALLTFSAGFLISAVIASTAIGRVLVAIRENEPRTRLLGYNTYAYKLLALVISGTISGAAGAAYALLFSYVGASFGAILYSIYPLLWTLLGGAGTTLGPLVGTATMFYLIDFTSGFTSAYLFIVGGALLVLVLWFPQGLMGAVRQRWVRWLP